MVGSLPGDLKVKKMTITTLSSSKVYNLMINPENFKRSFTVCTYTEPTPGTTGSPGAFTRSTEGDFTLTFIIDASGVTGRSPDDGSGGLLSPLESVGLNPFAGLDESAVENSIKHLLSVVYDYNSTLHRPEKVKIAFGDHYFEGTLSTLNLDYTHFYPSGKVLRASVTAVFKAIVEPGTDALKRNNMSPDVTHMHRVSRGERLDQLCKKIYGDSSWYMDVAKANNLTDYRNLEQGQEIFFPPLKK